MITTRQSTTINNISDRELTRISRPDGANVDLGYDSSGRPSTLTIPRGQVGYAYAATSQLVGTSSQTPQPRHPPTGNDEAVPETVPVPRALIPHLNECAVLLDIDGTLLDLAPTPREVWVQQGRRKPLNLFRVGTVGDLWRCRGV